jgi:hypothetical protein
MFRKFVIVQYVQNIYKVMGFTKSLICKVSGFHGGDYEETVFWDVVPCRSCVNRSFGGNYHLHLHDIKIRRLQPPAHAGSSLADFSTLKMEAICSSETSVYTRFTRLHIPEDGILQKSYSFIFYGGYTSDIFPFPKEGFIAILFLVSRHRQTYVLLVSNFRVSKIVTVFTSWCKFN